MLPAFVLLRSDALGMKEAMEALKEQAALMAERAEQDAELRAVSSCALRAACCLIVWIVVDTEWLANVADAQMAWQPCSSACLLLALPC